MNNFTSNENKRKATHGIRDNCITLPFRHTPLPVSKGFRALVLSKYPALTNHQNAYQFRRIMEYLLSTTFKHKKNDKDAGKTVLPYEAVAELVGLNPKTPGFSAQKWMDDFSRDVLPLNASDYRYTERKARLVNPEIDPEVLQALQHDRRHRGSFEEVCFADGIALSRRKKQAIIRAHEDYLKQLAGEADESHPAYRVLQYLLNQPQNFLSKVLSANWPLLKEAVYALPMGTEAEQRKREHNERVLDKLELFNRMYYRPAPNTARIFAANETVHQLPRQLRHIAFAGQVECDLKACQLAVVARLWGIEELQLLLESGQCIWTKLLEETGIAAEYKPIIKTTIYSLVFGMEKRNLLEQLINGDGTDEGIGSGEKADKFFANKIIKSLLSARWKQKLQLGQAGGCEDAFGRWVAVTPDKPIRSVMALVAQSYEMRIMMSILPVLKSDKQIKLLSWLHDGATLHFGNRTKQERQIKKLQEAVRKEAEALGMATSLEVTHLPTPAEIIRSNPSLR